MLSKRVAAPTLAGLALVVALFATAATASTAPAPTFTGWSAPVNLGPVVNSASTEQGPALSGDGLSLYFYSGRSGGVGSDDIWVSQRASVSAAWGMPANLGRTINSNSRDYVPAFSSDGHWMFFASDRPGGFGPPPPAAPTPDLYQSYRADIHDDFGWQTPTNLGANVNTAAAENGSGYFDNGGHPQLFFGSDRIGPAGFADLYVSDRQADGTWGPATLIPELSSTDTENRPTVRQDGLEIFFYSGREPRLAGSTAGSADLWTATRASVDAPWSAPVNLGPTVNSANNDIHPYLSSDGQTLVFSSTRPGSASSDLYMTTRDATPTVTGSPVSAVEGVPFSGAVATVTDPDTAATAAEYTATINWGDGSPVATGTVTGSGGSFTVTGSHTYTEEAGYPVTTTLTDVDTAANAATGTSRATVADAALTPGLIKVSCGSGPCAVASGFTDASPFGTTADFTATINWGDGSPTTAGVVGVAGPTGFVVSGTHAYADDGGGHTVMVTVSDDGGSTTSKTSPAATGKLTPDATGFVKGDAQSAVFTVTAACSAGSTAGAWLNGVEVHDGDSVRLKSQKDGDQSVKWQGNRLSMNATSFQLVVVCTDSAGNEGATATSPAFGEQGDSPESVDPGNGNTK